MRPCVYIIDFEGSLASGVVEYGCVVLSGACEIVETNTRLCKPQAPILLHESQCHGIFNQDVSTCASFTEDLEYFTTAHQRGVFCAHNAVFENQLLSRYCPLPPVNSALCLSEDKLAWGPWLDTYGLYKRWLPAKTDCKLEQLILRYALEGELNVWAEKYCPPQRRHYHCALYDALASTLLLANFLHMPEHRDKGISWLIAYSSLGAKSFNDRLQTSFF